MKRILIVGQKGGTGKTFLADQLAYSFEATKTPYAFYQLDSQGGSQHDTAVLDGAEVSIIDTPGYLTDDTPTMVEDADVIVLPTRASPTDLPALERMRELIRTHAPGTPVILVLNAWNRYTNTKSFTDYLLKSRDSQETLVCISQSEVVPQAAGNHVAVPSYAPKSKAAEGVRQLTNAVRNAIGFELEPEIIHVPRKKEGS